MSSIRKSRKFYAGIAAMALADRDSRGVPLPGRCDILGVRQAEVWW